MFGHSSVYASIMKKITVPVFSNLLDPALIDILLGGGVGVLLTDTVYGLVGSARIHAAASKVIDAKGRKYKPGTLIAADTKQLLDLGIQREHVKAAKQFWPGPVSLVLPTRPGLEYLDLGLASLAVRVPTIKRSRSYSRKSDHCSPPAPTVQMSRWSRV